jgi:hypothetical protein
MLAFIDRAGRLFGVTVADSPEQLWVAVQAALRQREGRREEAAHFARPRDFAEAMRRVEAEIYDAV